MKRIGVAELTRCIDAIEPMELDKLAWVIWAGGEEWLEHWTEDLIHSAQAALSQPARQRPPEVARLLAGWQFLWGVSAKGFQQSQGAAGELSRNLRQAATRAFTNWERLDDALRNMLTQKAYRDWIDDNEVAAKFRLLPAGAMAKEDKGVRESKG